MCHANRASIQDNKSISPSKLVSDGPHSAALGVEQVEVRSVQDELDMASTPTSNRIGEAGRNDHDCLGESIAESFQPAPKLGPSPGTALAHPQAQEETIGRR